jgi:hypothetical protein
LLARNSSPWSTLQRDHRRLRHGEHQVAPARAVAAEHVPARVQQQRLHQRSGQSSGGERIRAWGWKKSGLMPERILDGEDGVAVGVEEDAGGCHYFLHLNNHEIYTYAITFFSLYYP